MYIMTITLQTKKTKKKLWDGMGRYFFLLFLLEDVSFLSSPYVDSKSSSLLMLETKRYTVPFASFLLQNLYLYPCRPSPVMTSAVAQ